MNDLPRFYSSLREFRTVFDTGLPILTYHKLGPRPAGVRMKGLYVSKRLFLRQLAEWSDNQWSTTLPETPGSPAATPQVDSTSSGGRQGQAPSNRQLVITFDDGFENVLRHGLEPLAQHGFQAVQFLVADLLGSSNLWEQRSVNEAPERLMDPSQVREWLAAGHEIGAHSLSHPHLTQVPAPQAREEIGACRKKLEDLFGRPIRHFCYPFGDWNPTVREWVKEAGYSTACTVDPGVNPLGCDPFALKRFTARYHSRNWRAIFSTLRRWFRPSRRNF